MIRINFIVHFNGSKASSGLQHAIDLCYIGLPFPLGRYDTMMPPPPQDRHLTPILEIMAVLVSQCI